MMVIIAFTTKVHTDVHVKMDSPVMVKHASIQTNVLMELTLVASSQIVLIEMVILTRECIDEYGGV